VTSIMLMRAVQRLVPKMEIVPKEIDILQEALAVRSPPRTTAWSNC